MKLRRRNCSMSCCAMSCCAMRTPLQISLPNDCLGDLAGPGHRQGFRRYLHRLRDLVAADQGSAVRDQILRRRAASIREHHDRPHLLAPMLMWNAEDGGLDHFGMG